MTSRSSPSDLGGRDAVEQHGASSRLGHRARRDGAAGDDEARLVDAGERAAGEVGVEEREAERRGGGERREAVDAGHLERHERGGRRARPAGERLDGLGQLGAGRELLAQHGGGSDVAHRDHEVIRVEVVEPEPAHGRVPQLAGGGGREDPRVAAPARAEQEEPRDEVGEVVDSQVPAHGRHGSTRVPALP